MITAQRGQQLTTRNSSFFKPIPMTTQPMKEEGEEDAVEDNDLDNAADVAADVAADTPTNQPTATGTTATNSGATLVRNPPSKRARKPPPTVDPPSTTGPSTTGPPTAPPPTTDAVKPTRVRRPPPWMKDLRSEVVTIQMCCSLTAVDCDEQSLCVCRSTRCRHVRTGTVCEQSAATSAQLQPLHRYNHYTLQSLQPLHIAHYSWTMIGHHLCYKYCMRRMCRMCRVLCLCNVEFLCKFHMGKLREIYVKRSFSKSSLVRRFTSAA